MRVFIDRRMPNGGVGRYGRDLVDALRAGADVEIVAYPSEVLEGPVTGAGSVVPWVGMAASRAAAAAAPHVVHCTHLQTLRIDVPQVVTIHDLIPLEYPKSMPNPLRRAAFERILRRSIDRARAIIVPSSATADALDRRGVSRERVSVIPHGVADRFHPLSDEQRRTARERFASGASYIATVLSNKAHKNVSVLSDVARLLGEERRIVGAGGPAPTGVIAAGPLTDEDLVLLLGGADAFVSPSVVEGFGLPALEAMACGTPVVCGTGLGALDVVAPSVTVVDVNDPVAVAAALEGAAASPEPNRSVGLEIAAGLSLELMGEKTLAVYRAVLDGRER